MSFDDELIGFIVEAKRTALKEREKEKTTQNGWRTLYFPKGRFVYAHMRQAGILGKEWDVCGVESVFYDDKPAWRMHYGNSELRPLIEREIEREKIFGFLEKALMEMPESHPFRGPDKFEDPQFEGMEYKNHFSGNWRKFWGFEEITYRGMVVYYLEYSGYKF